MEVWKRPIFARRHFSANDDFMKIIPQLLVASIILISGILVAFSLAHTAPQIPEPTAERRLPEVSVMTVKLQTTRIEVRSQGTVKARNEIDLIAEVSGRIIDVSPHFVTGGFFHKNDVLLSVDPLDYDVKVSKAKAAVMEARRKLAKEEAEAKQAGIDWQRLGNKNQAGDLVLHRPQLAEMRAKLSFAETELLHAKTQQQRTLVRAPFDGRVLKAHAGFGQYVTENLVLATIYDTATAEIRLPVSVRELAFVDPENTESVEPPLPVTLTAPYLGRQQTWQAQIVRSEGVIDNKTGMMTLVANVEDPYARKANGGKPPLPIGLFVEAVIKGHPIDNIAVLPSRLVHPNGRVPVIDEDQRIRFRTIDILHREQERVFVLSGLVAGDRIISAGLEHPIEDMQVTVRAATMSQTAATDPSSRL